MIQPRPEHGLKVSLWALLLAAGLTAVPRHLAARENEALVPGEEAVEQAEVERRGARRFWSYQKPVRHAIPEVKHTEQVRTAIDCFILERLERRGISLSEEADRRVLIRRVYFDLVGLPPSPEEVAAFIENPSPSAYEELVDRLLDSPHYGERWGRHWLDVAGYAESNGIIGDGLIPHAWRFRDYVIRSFNNDKPYDRFLLEQFAGDELVDWRNADEMTPEIEEALTATGFLRCTPDGTDNQNIFQLEKRWDHLHATVEVAMKAAAGVILNCARCHDHKFDPISQEDYYKVVALFQPAYNPDDWIPCTDFRKLYWPVRYILKGGKRERERTIQTYMKLGRVISALKKERRDRSTAYHDRWLIKMAGKFRITEEQLIALKTAKGQRSIELERIAADLRAKHPVDSKRLEGEFPELKEQLRRIDQELAKNQRKIAQADRQKIWALWDVSPEPPVTRLLERGDFLSPGRVVSPGVPTMLDDPEQPFSVPEPGEASTGRRLALARWLTRTDHPLTARVLVNRLWHYHFGRGIVATLDDFGSQGARPTHPELLDWLATWFVEHGWSIKALHRLIMASTVYRQSVALDPGKARLDPDNRLWWRRTPRRMEAEVIRDSILSVTGTLDLSLFGPPVSLEQLPDGQYVVDPRDPGAHRRSVYIRVRRTTPVSFLEVFDAPKMDSNVPERFQSTVPLQALSLMNSPFVVESAERFARRLQREVPDDVRRRIERAFLLVYSRPPSSQEIEWSLELVQGGAGARETWALFCQGLLASNEFLYVN